MVDELGLPELIDTVIKQDPKQRQVLVGQCVKAMVLNGLGFVNRTLYLRYSPLSRPKSHEIKIEAG